MAPSTEGERALELAAQARASFDVEALVTHLSAAVRAFTAAGEVRSAAMAAAALGDALVNGMGNLTAGLAWFARASAMLADEPACIEQGWVAVAAMGCDVGDPERLLAAAELALDRARRFGDVNLEAKALADGGLAHVQAGRIEHGMALLDEAMALVCGPADDEDVAGKSACSFFTACYYSVDFERAASWAELLRARGLIAPRTGAPVFLSNHCDSVQACLLCELGRWSEAEALLLRAGREFVAATGQPSWHPDIQLAELRIRQGRLADAEALLLGKDLAYEALLPFARLQLARGDHELAAASARRGLRTLGDDHLRAVELLTVLVDAELARGDLAAAGEACGALAERLAVVDRPVLHARSAPAQARFLAAGGDVAAAIAHLEAVLAGLGPERAPYQRVRVLLALAALHERAGDRAAAALDAKVAQATLAGLDVVIPADDQALLDRLAGRTAVVPDGQAVCLAADGSSWVVSSGGVRVRLRGTKGLAYLAELVANPGVERHALDLVDRAEGAPLPGEVDRRSLGDAGELLDATARAAYRRRIEALRSECDDALASGALDRAEALQAELDALVGQLAQAFGLGGRARRASSAAERARLNVTRAIRAAISRIEEELPAAAAVLDRRVRTGTYCAYEPVDGEPRWIVQSALNDPVPG